MQAARHFCTRAVRQQFVSVDGIRSLSASRSSSSFPLNSQSIQRSRFATTSIHTRSLSSTPVSSNEQEEQQEQPAEAVKFIAYEAPFAKVLGILKKVSVASCGITLVSVPLLTVFGNPEMDVVHRVAVGCVAAAAAMGTTAALHKVGSPYIKTMVAYDNASGGISLELHTFTLFGTPMMTVIDDMETQLVAAPERAWASFRDTKSNKYFYVHEEWDETMFFDRDIFDRIVAISGSKDVTPKETPE